jgi:nucleotide-binding universal stress UspA family protein
VANALNPLKTLELKSILVATDFTEATDKALDHGIAIARHYRAVLYVVYVVSSIAFTIAGPDAVDLAATASERDINKLVNALVESGKLNGIEVRPIVLRGNVDEQMEAFARAQRVDLIVAGTHGRQGMARLYMGSVAELISKCCCSPVLTVGPHASGPWLDNPADSGKPLLFATAFNNASAKALPFAVSLAHDFERPLYVLHVIPPLHGHLLGHSREPQNDNHASAVAQFHALMNSRPDCGREATLLVESGDPSDGIIRMAKRVHAATIIMGAHRESFTDLAIRLPWSITNHVNREAKCPVLTVRG